MALSIGEVLLDSRATHVKERLEEVGGRDERRILVAGVVTGLSTREAIEARLDAIVQAASVENWSAALSLRPGRRLWVRREGYSREVDSAGRTGAFELKLSARDPFEESIDEVAIAWNVDGVGAVRAFATNGNAPALPVFGIVAATDLALPGIDDGRRGLVFDGVVRAGQTLQLDGARGAALLDGEDVTPYTLGEFPRITPGGTALTYKGDPVGPHAATVTVAYRHRWW